MDPISIMMMALEALRVAQAVEPYAALALTDLLKLFHPTDAGAAMLSMNEVVGYAVEALNAVAALKFSSDDPVANTIGQWNSAYVTVLGRAQLLNPAIDPAAVKTAMDIASHKTGTDSPLDVIGAVVPAAS